MSYILAMAENLLLIVALPWLITDVSRNLVARIDSRGMFSIPFCRSLAVACGGVLAIATGVMAGFQTEISLTSLWDIFGFWHTGRFLTILERYMENLLWSPTGSMSAPQLLFVRILLMSTAFLTAINGAIAVMGWRSLAAVRGVMAHIVVSLSVWMIVTVRGLAALWILHWLNFWTIAIVLIVLELRRREEATTRLSF